MDARTRRVFLAQAGALAAVPLLPRVAWAAPPDVPVVGAPPLTNEQYLALADRIMWRLNHTWVRHQASYSAGSLNVGVIYNAALLTVHATAARGGARGRARATTRGRGCWSTGCARRRRSSSGRAGSAGRCTTRPGGCRTSTRSTRRRTSRSIRRSPKGWRRRGGRATVLQLTPAQVDRLAHCVDVVARDRFFRYPAVRLNQINWPAELYANAALVTGDPGAAAARLPAAPAALRRGVRHPLDEGRHDQPRPRLPVPLPAALSGRRPEQPGQRRVRVDDPARAARLRRGARRGDGAAAGRRTSRS